MNRAGMLMLAGTDVGSIPLVYPGFSLHEELELLVREGGLTPMQALQSATSNPPRFFGLAAAGTIVPGAVADLVLLGGDPVQDITNTQKIAGVVLAGRYFDRQQLDALLLDAER
jgi:imidazolonepropionase-like amidohydrolase